ncbi:MAG: hypothetical protein KC503_01740, partial [Myxococcales bacterium]|nr:hypothetical protein [Myxococcales bacterium]
IIDDLLESQGKSRQVVRLVPYFLAGLQMVANSDYLLTISERLAQRMAPIFGLQIIPTPFDSEPYSLKMLWHPRYEHDPIQRWMRSIWMRPAARAHAHARPRQQPLRFAAAAREPPRVSAAGDGSRRA